MTSPFDLDHRPGTAWPETLRPLGENTGEKEAFAAWWARNRAARRCGSSMADGGAHRAAERHRGRPAPPPTRER